MDSKTPNLLIIIGVAALVLSMVLRNTLLSEAKNYTIPVDLLGYALFTVGCYRKLQALK
jgi:hypothetical protein